MQAASIVPGSHHRQSGKASVHKVWHPIPCGLLVALVALASPIGVTRRHSPVTTRPRSLGRRPRPSPVPCPSSLAIAGSTRSTGASCRRRSGSAALRDVVRAADVPTGARSCTSATDCGGTRTPAPGVVGRASGTDACDRRTPPSCRCAGRGCSCRRAISTTTRRTTRPTTSPRCVSGVTSSTTLRSTGGGAPSRCGLSGRAGTCLRGRMGEAVPGPQRLTLS